MVYKAQACTAYATYTAHVNVVECRGDLEVEFVKSWCYVETLSGERVSLEYRTAVSEAIQAMLLDDAADQYLQEVNE